MQCGITFDPTDLEARKSVLAILARFETEAETTTPARKKKAIVESNEALGEQIDAIEASQIRKEIRAKEADDSFDLGGGQEEEVKEEKRIVTRSDMLKVLKAHPSKERVTKLLQTKFKVKNINELKEEQYGDVVDAVNALK